MTPVVITPSHPDARDEAFPYDIIRYPSIDLRQFTGGYLAGIPFSPDIAGQLQQKSVELLHSHCPVISNFMARELRQIVDAPIVMTYHTKFDIDIASILKTRLMQQGSVHALVQNITPCDEVWAVSQGAADNLHSLGYEGDVIVMPNGVDLPKGRVDNAAVKAAAESYDLPEGVPVFLFVGRIRWYKGLRIILDALAKLKAEQIPFRMVFIGSGSELEDVQDYASELNLNDCVFFTGTIRGRELLRAWYCRANLFLFPSTFDTNGLVVREAAACSLPTVMIANSCASEGVTDNRNGFLIEENADSMFACLKNLCANPAVMAQVGEHAAEELYMSWEDAVAIASQRYEVVIDRFRSGLYPTRHHPMEEVLRANGELMEGLSHIQSKRRELAEKITEQMEHLRDLME